LRQVRDLNEAGAARISRGEKTREKQVLLGSSARFVLDLEQHQSAGPPEETGES
jgi:hypothetical protein